MGENSKHSRVHYLDFGFVVLHGSDTMSYSASALSFMLENLSKPVIFTGSQLPIGDLRTDAKENLITAIQIASLQENGLPLLLRCAFILNISCIEETERPRSMRNICIHVTQLSCYGRIWGSFKYEKRIVLAEIKARN
jgi:hypothetical protein